MHHNGIHRTTAAWQVVPADKGGLSELFSEKERVKLNDEHAIVQWITERDIPRFASRRREL
jgi:hypothetical protein